MKRIGSTTSVADYLGIDPLNVALLVERGMPHERDEEGRFFFEFGEVDEWVATQDWMAA